MKQALIFAGAVAALALTSAPANAAPVPATTNATATARIYTPLTLTSVRDLDLGTIVLSGSGSYTDTVGIDQGGVFSCGSGNVTCSGTTQTAQYYATGTMNQTLTVIVPATLALVNQTQAAPNLTLTVDAPATVVLNGSGEVTFDIGGSIAVSDTTIDGVYQGTFNVQADYQ